jgi:hypothetical protein
MDVEPEGTLEVFLQIAGAPIGPLASAPLEMCYDLRRQLVALPGPAPLRQQASNSRGFERSVRLIGGRQRDTEQTSRHRDRHIVDAMLAHHLVAHLKEIARVEETVAAELRIDDGLRVAIERARRRERCQLGIGVSSGRSSCQLCRSMIELCRSSAKSYGTLLAHDAIISHIAFECDKILLISAT